MKNTAETFTRALDRINAIIVNNGHDGDHFAAILRRERIPHLSFSQVTTVESCQRRYYLQYVLGREPDPIPTYFIKGKRMHDRIARTYESMRAGSGSAVAPLPEGLHDADDGIDSRHIANAYQVHRENLWSGYAIRGVEHPFVFSISPDLPPLVGVIDLMLADAEQIILVDHKTGRDFYPDDALQVAIYARYIRTRFNTDQVRLFYDHYRWVNNLDRIRKPAFERREVDADPRAWGSYLARIARAYRVMETLTAGRRPLKDGECFRCPYRGGCT